jgi:G3E family GTPase
MHCVQDADGIVGLQNGCACCSGRDDLFARLEELAESEGIGKTAQPWDRLVVEVSSLVLAERLL